MQEGTTGEGRGRGGRERERGVRDAGQGGRVNRKRRGRQGESE